MVLIEYKDKNGGCMKNFFKTMITTAALGLAFAVGAQAGPLVKDVVVGINDVFVPGGFDSQADSYVVVSGIFPNGCYKWKGAKVNQIDSLNHEVTSVAEVSQGMCLQVLVPFSKDIKLGKLESGVHTLRFMSGDGTYLEKKMVIE